MNCLDGSVKQHNSLLVLHEYYWQKKKKVQNPKKEKKTLISHVGMSIAKFESVEPKQKM